MGSTKQSGALRSITVMGNNIRQLLINYRDMQAEVNDAYQKINQDDSPMSFDRIEELESESNG